MNHAAHSASSLETPKAGAVPAADVRVALELLLELGVRALDGDRSSLHALPSALCIAEERLREHHVLREQRARSRAALARAQARSERDLEELARIHHVLVSCDAREAARLVLSSCLGLLDGIANDERPRTELWSCRAL